MEDLTGAKLFEEWRKRGYYKSSQGGGFDVSVDIEKLDYSDYVAQDFGMFVGDKKHFTYEEFKHRDMMTY